jgi:hypothetical protein
METERMSCGLTAYEIRMIIQTVTRRSENLITTTEATVPQIASKACWRMKTAIRPETTQTVTMTTTSVTIDVLLSVQTGSETIARVQPGASLFSATTITRKTPYRQLLKNGRVRQVVTRGRSRRRLQNSCGITIGVSSTSQRTVSVRLKTF